MALRFADLATDYHLLFPPRIAAVELLAQLAGPAPARCVDAGCGVGDYCALLATRGYECFGAEVERGLVDAARERHAHIATRLIHGDILEVFDLVRGPLALGFCI